MMQENVPKEYHASIISTIPMQRFGTPGDIGDAVALLASESARWITGQNIVVAGGQKD